MLLGQDEDLSDVARESGRNVTQCKSKLKVLSDIEKESKKCCQEKMKFVKRYDRKLKVLHILQVKCEGLSNIARGNQEDCWMLPDKALLGVKR
jgi:hypothetical protein